MSPIPWFKVDDNFCFHPKAMAAGNAALGLWVRAGSWCGANLTGGWLPAHMVRTLGGQRRDADKLVAAGLWMHTGRTRNAHQTHTEHTQDAHSAASGNAGQECTLCARSDGYQFKGWDEYQPTKAQVEAEREATRERQRRWREGKRNAVTNAVTNSVTNAVSNAAPTRPDPTHIKEPQSGVADATPRPEVEELLDLLDEGIDLNGLRVPNRNKRNRDAMRLLIDRDGYTPEQVAWIIRWACSDEFWRTNILSASKLREKFPQLVAKSGAGTKPRVVGFGGEIDVDAILGRDLWSLPTPPDDITPGTPAYREWADQQRAARRAQRLEEARAVIARRGA